MGRENQKTIAPKPLAEGSLSYFVQVFSRGSRASSLKQRSRSASLREIAASDAGNKQEAIQALANATGQLDIILARSPDLALVPVEYTVTAIAPCTEQSPDC